ncbi:restriction endonuclease subunit S [Corynebacterium testudinoris]|uniref:Restriction endonuclease S subunit n=1 Tax=Corynebacterium testudinoris TaxID=136857 RepID=A0A0G3H8R8_9CORY|nr:restriction endonuclease subunit S [Corynebacterium testudinoris]AKK07572.1 restriction endonuclease S subunit [Corynebacterium testudinoris]
MVRLGDVVEIPSTLINPTDISADASYLGLEDLNKGGGIQRFQTAAGSDIQSTKRVFSDQHILFGRLRPNLQKIAISSRPGICTTDILTIEPGGYIDQTFLYHFLLTPFVLSFTSEHTTGINLPRISPKQLLELPIPLPPLDEQRRIAGILDRAAGLVGQTSQAQARISIARSNAVEDTLKKAGGTTVRLDSLAEIKSGITKGRRVRDEEVYTARPYLAVSNVKDGYLDLTEVKMLETSLDEQDRFALADGDLLLTEGGDPDKLGRGTVWRGEIPGCLHQNHIFRVRLNDETLYTSDTLMSVLASRHLKSYFLRSAKQTTGIASINRSQLSAAPIPVLSAKQLDKLGSLLASCDKLSQHLNNRLKAVASLQQSLRTRAFQGKLR